MKEIYGSKEWKEIEPLARAHIILVKEKVKLGATFGSFKNIAEILDKLSLYYHVQLEKERFKPLKFYVIHISNSPKIIEKVVKITSGKLKIKKPHTFWGKFYSYPTCCIKKYSEEIEKSNPRRRFILQLLKLKQEEKFIPEEFFYLMPTQVPCSPFCKNTLKVLRKWKQVLHKVDKEVAEWLRNWNKEELKDEMEIEERELRKL